MSEVELLESGREFHLETDEARNMFTFPLPRNLCFCPLLLQKSKTSGYILVLFKDLFLSIC